MIHHAPALPQPGGRCCCCWSADHARRDAPDGHGSVSVLHAPVEEAVLLLGHAVLALAAARAGLGRPDGLDGTGVAGLRHDGREARMLVRGVVLGAARRARGPVRAVRVLRGLAVGAVLAAGGGARRRVLAAVAAVGAPGGRACVGDAVAGSYGVDVVIVIIVELFNLVLIPEGVADGRLAVTA